MEAQTGRSQILLVEDSVDDETLVRRTLACNGIDCSLRVLADGKQAFRFIEEVDADFAAIVPHVIMLDIDLPYHNGLEVLRKLRESERCGRTPVILMSGSEHAGSAFHEAKKHAPRHFFQKRADDGAFMELGQIIRDLLPPDQPAQGCM